MLSLFFALSLPATSVAQAQAPAPCRDTDTVAPTAERRSLRLAQFGITVEIPDNYRAILRNDGSVQVVDPGTYNLIRCEILGGDPLGRGYSELVIRSAEATEADSLEATVREDVYAGPNRNAITTQACITPYPFKDQQGYLVQSGSGRHAEFWLEPQVGADVVVLETSCDCSGMVDRLLSVLDRTELLSRGDLARS